MGCARRRCCTSGPDLDHFVERVGQTYHLSSVQPGRFGVGSGPRLPPAATRFERASKSSTTLSRSFTYPNVRRERRRVHEDTVLAGGADALVADVSTGCWAVNAMMEDRSGFGIRRGTPGSCRASRWTAARIPARAWLSLDDFLVRLVAAGALLAVEVLFREDQLVAHPRGAGGVACR